MNRLFYDIYRKGVSPQNADDLVKLLDDEKSYAFLEGDAWYTVLMN